MSTLSLGDIMINVEGKSLGKQLNLYGNPSVLNIPWCTHDIPPVYSMISPQCTKHPPVYCTDIIQGENNLEKTLNFEAVATVFSTVLGHSFNIRIDF